MKNTLKCVFDGTLHDMVFRLISNKIREMRVFRVKCAHLIAFLMKYVHFIGLPWLLSVTISQILMEISCFVHFKVKCMHFELSCHARILNWVAMRAFHWNQLFNHHQVGSFYRKTKYYGDGNEPHKPECWWWCCLVAFWQFLMMLFLPWQPDSQSEYANQCWLATETQQQQ